MADVEDRSQAIWRSRRRQARRYLEAGAAVRKRAGGNSDSRPTDYVLSLDVSDHEVQKAIEAKLGGASPGSVDARALLERRSGGASSSPARDLLRLGDGRFDRGKQFVHAVVKQIRARRVLSKAPIAGLSETAFSRPLRRRSPLDDRATDGPSQTAADAALFRWLAVVSNLRWPVAAVFTGLAKW